MAISNNIRVATLNIRGLSSNRKQNQLYRLITEHELDVLAVQETKIESQDQTDSMVRKFTRTYNVCVSHARGLSGGSLLLIRRCLGGSVDSVTTDDAGRLIVCDFTLLDCKLRFLCIYAPSNSNERDLFFRSLEQHLKTDRFIIALGDFNCVLSASDKTSPTPYRDSSTDILDQIIEEHLLEDVGECLGLNACVRFTHFQGISHARLDRAYVSAELLAFCREYRVTHVSFTDHSLVKFDIGKLKERSKFKWENWKFNDKLLHDDDFAAHINEAVQKLLTIDETTLREQWDLFKQGVKLKALESASRIQHEKRKQEKSLHECLGILIAEECQQPGMFKDDILAVKQKLEAIDEDRYRGAILRSRAERMVAGETPTKRSFGIEKKRAHINHISQIEWQGVICVEKGDIQRAFYDYYSNVFAHSSGNIEAFKNEFLHSMPSIDDDAKELLEMPISIEEVKMAIDELNPNKSPGPDGLTAAFYKSIKHSVATVLTSLFNNAYDVGLLPPSFLTSHTVLIPKTKDARLLRQVSSYRPIALTNVDYKIYMKVLAKRLQMVINELVGEHQTCGIKGRTILTNIHKARCVLECCDTTGEGIAMIQLDLEKAFDRVPHDVLLCILQHVNVGSVIRDGVAMAYRGCTTRIIVNKTVGERIKVHRSVRQGCPLSSLLFCLYIEPFCLSVINSTNIRGFRLHATEVRLLAYADDIAVFCSNQETVLRVVNIAKHFCRVSGSAINWGKSLGFWHGYWLSTPSIFANMSWVTTPVKYLGVPLQHYRDSEHYWRGEVAAIRESSERFKGFNISIFARATICNLFLISKLWYVLQVLHCSRVNIQKLHRVFAVFVWGSTWERTKRTSIFRRVRLGGLGLSHLYLRQLVNRFMFFRNATDPFLRTVCQVRLGKHLPNLIVWSENMPGSISGYMREVYLSCRILQNHFSLEYLCGVSRKKLYKDLCDVFLPAPLYRTQYNDGPGQDILKRVKNMPVRGGVKTFFFKLHTNTLEVKTYMEEKGMFVPWGTHCFICRKPETIEHVFLDCSGGYFFWDILQRTLKKDLPIDSYGIRFLPVNNDEGIPFDMIMLLGLHSIWLSRMAYRHADIDARPIRSYFRESVSRMVQVYKLHEPEPDWLPRLEGLMYMPEF